MKISIISRLLLLTIFSILTRISWAQSNSGVYLNATDYLTNTLTQACGDCKIKSHEVFYTKVLEVVNEGNKFTFQKDSIYGYKSGSDSYRINHDDNEAYLIAEAGAIIIYILHEPENSTKAFSQRPHFYFSKDATSGILPLTAINLKKTFPGDLRLQHYLDLEFYQTDIASYNEEHHLYQINYLLNQLKQNNNF